MPAPPRLTVDLLAGARRTRGVYAVLHAQAHRAVRLRRHVVDREHLHLWVLAGEVGVSLDGVHRSLGAGDDIALPRRLPRAVTLAPATRLVCLVVPAGREELLTLLDADLPEDDVAALLAAAGVRLVPRNPPVRPGH